MIVVADTSPLHYLVLIGGIELLPALYGRVAVPPDVIEELRASKTPPPVRAWADRPPPWLDVREPVALIDADDIDRGERAAISLAIELDAGVLLLDDLDGRRVAVERYALTINGTLGVIRDAAIAGFVDLEPSIEALLATSFRIDDGLIAKVRASVLRHHTWGLP